MGIRVHGISNLINNLNSEARKIEKSTERGLLNAANLLRRSMEAKYPKTPVDTGNLRSSWTVQPVSSPTSKKIRMGYTANYAFFVHEMVGGDFDAGVNWSRPGSGPKWFSVAIDRETDAMINEIAMAIRQGTIL